MALAEFLNNLDVYADCEACGEPVVPADPASGMLCLDQGGPLG